MSIEHRAGIAQAAAAHLASADLSLLPALVGFDGFIDRLRFDRICGNRRGRIIAPALLLDELVIFFHVDPGFEDPPNGCIAHPKLICEGCRSFARCAIEVNNLALVGVG